MRPTLIVLLLTTSALAGPNPDAEYVHETDWAVGLAFRTAAIPFATDYSIIFDIFGRF